MIKDFEIIEGSHRWQNLIAIDADRETVSNALDAAFEEHLRRNPSAPTGNPLTRTSGPTPNQSHWTRGDKIALATLVIGVLAVIGTYLAIPGFQDWVKTLLGTHASPKSKIETVVPAISIRNSGGPTDAPEPRNDRISRTLLRVGYVDPYYGGPEYSEVKNLVR